MKNLIYILILFFLVSCEDEFLNKEPLDIISDAAVWNDENYTNAVLTNLYARAPFYGLFRNDYVWEPWDYAISPVDELHVSDESRAAYTWERTLTDYNKGFITRDMAPLSYWNYGLIRSINEFLENVEKSTMPVEKVSPKIGEAKFIRAFVYFQLVKRYGGVPIITRPQKIDEGDELFVSRNTEKEVYDFILDQCDEAALVLPETYSDSEVGRATKFAALALKSRAALFAGSIAKYGQVQLDGLLGMPSNDANSYFQKSYDASKTITESNKFSLFNKYPNDKVKNYASIFVEEGHNEVIFSKAFVPKDLAHNFDYFNMPHGLKTAGWGSATNVTLDLVNAYEMVDGSNGSINFENETAPLSILLSDKDPRLLASVFYNGAKWKSDSANFYYGVYHNNVLYNERGKVVPGTNILQVGLGVAHNDGTKTGFVIKKYLKESLNITSSRNDSDQDWIEFRYAEILLNYAEAAYELNKPDEALSAINQIRDRAGIANLDEINLEKIRHERRIELALEGHRYWDIRRWRIAESVLNDRRLKGLEAYWNIDNNTYVYKVIDADGYARVFRPHFYYLPISNTVTNNNPNIAENPGY